MASMILMCCFPSDCNESAIPFEWVCCVWCLPVVQFSDLSCIRSLPSLEPWRPRDVPRAGRPPPRRVARGRRPGGRPSAARRRAARSAAPAGASPRRVVTMPKNMVQKQFCVTLRVPPKVCSQWLRGFSNIPPQLPKWSYCTRRAVLCCLCDCHRPACEVGIVINPPLSPPLCFEDR